MIGALQFRPILFILGQLLVVLAASMVLPAFADLFAHNPDWEVFAFSAGMTGYIGLLMILGNRGGNMILNREQAFLLTAGGWIAMCGFGAVPFLFIGDGLSYTDAFFESVSGLTTTGSTILTGLDIMPPGILLWRGLLQWLGGLGIIAMAIAVLPYLRVGGMQLFRMESSDRSEKFLPRANELARSIALVYLGLSCLCTLAYWAAGMQPFDALVHSMSTISTGGYANFDASFGHFGRPVIEWVGVVFMILGSLPFVLYVRALRGDRRALWHDQQVRGFLLTLAFVIAGTSLWLSNTGNLPIWESLRLVAFNVVSIVTTTGYASTNYETWSQGTQIMFLLLTFMGGCTGSTAGAIKVFRIQIMRLMIERNIVKLMYPNAVVPLRFDGRPVSDDVVISVASFMFVMISTVAVLTLALSAFGLDYLTSLSAAATAVCNVGPGLGEIVGPAGNFSTLPDAAKWLLTLGMLLGRLEYFTLLVLILPRFWRA
jgi:trk system potassium uptake protein TrkH